MRTLNLFLLFFFLFALNSYSLPQCEGDDFRKWTNCEGTETFANGEKYVGGFKDGEQHGKGTYTWGKGPNEGAKYVGEYKDGKYHGKGTFTFADGDKYVGEFKDGKYHGKGTYTYSDGSKDEGIWKNGELVE